MGFMFPLFHWIFLDVPMMFPYVSHMFPLFHGILMNCPMIFPYLFNIFPCFPICFHMFNGNFRNLNWRYLPYLRPIFQAYVREYPHKKCPEKWYSISILGSWRSPIDMFPFFFRCFHIFHGFSHSSPYVFIFFSIFSMDFPIFFHMFHGFSMVSTGCFHHLRFQKRRPPAPRAASAHVAQPGRCWDPPGPLGRSPAGPSGNDVENPWEKWGSAIYVYNDDVVANG